MVIGIYIFLEKGVNKMYNGIFLDIDDTIFDYDKCSRNALKQTCSQCNIPYSENIVFLFRSIDDALWKKQKQGLLSIEEVLRMRAEMLTDKLGKVEQSKKFEKCFQEELSTEIILVAKADEILMYLSEKVPIYAASNGIKATQLNRLNKANLLQYFTDIYISDDIGFEKPDIFFFNECMKRSNLTHSQILMVGDSLEADMVGADKADIDTCWYNPTKKENDTKIRLKYEITELLELKNII